MNLKDGIEIKGRIRLQKWYSDEDFEAFQWHEEHPTSLGNPFQPYEDVEFDNIFLLTGINEMWRLITGASANTFTQANTQLGVGDSSTAATSAQTDLQAATNKTYVTSTSVTVGGNGGTTATMIIVSTFGSASANYAWNEMVVKQATSAICLDRAVSAQGTKTSGQSWTLTFTLTMS